MRLPLGIVLSLLLVKFIQAQLPGRSYVIEHVWNTLDFVLVNPTSYVQDGYDRRNIIVEDAVKTLDSRTIVSTKVYDRLPTLSILSNLFNRNSIVLTPFPNIDFHVTIDSCRQIMEVRALLIDDYQRLWVLSKGLGTCSDRLLVFSLTTNQLIAQQALVNGILNGRRKEDEIYNGASIEAPRESLNSVTIYCDDYDSLLRLKIELGRSSNGGLDMNITYTITNRLYIPAMTFIQNGLTAMSLSPYTNSFSRSSSANPVYPERYLYFGVLPDNNLYRKTISLSVDGPIEYVPYKATQQAISRDGVVFYSLNGYDGMDCYNFRNQPHQLFNGFLFRDFTDGFYSSLKTYQFQINNNNQEERLMAFYKIKPKDPNVNNRYYAIITGRVTDIVRGTDCRP